MQTTTQLPDTTEREIRIRRRLRDDFSHYATRCLNIRTKAGHIRRFELNRSQLYLHEKLEAQRASTGRVRALVLKGRQVGISTYIAGRFYWRLSHARGFRAFILTHLDTATDNLFSIAKRMHDHCPELVRPQTGSANAKELSFPLLESGYKVATAGGRDVGRSETIQLFHGSEMAFWPNADMHDAGIGQAIADADGTEDIRESTANGIGNAFHALWKAAERGDSSFTPIFIPWFWHEEYVGSPPLDWSAPSDWSAYGEAYGLNAAQVYWAWRKNRDMQVATGGNPDEIGWKFRQEYPANADEAFQTSGEKAFVEPEAVLKARKAKVTGYGPIVLGVDPARGGGDKTGLIDRQGRRLGGHCCRRIDRDDLMAVTGEIVREIQRLRPLGLRKVCVDTTGLGAGIYDRLMELGHGDLVEPVNFGARAIDDRHYVNRRAEMWDEMRKWFDDAAGVQVPDTDDLQGDLCSISWGKGATRFDSAGRLLLESKDHIRERGMASPDLGDAAALTFAVELHAAAHDDIDTGFRAMSSGWMR